MKHTVSLKKIMNLEEFIKGKISCWEVFSIICTKKQI